MKKEYRILLGCALLLAAWFVVQALTMMCWYVQGASYGDLGTALAPTFVAGIAVALAGVVAVTPPAS